MKHVASSKDASSITELDESYHLSVSLRNDEEYLSDIQSRENFHTTSEPLQDRLTIISLESTSVRIKLCVTRNYKLLAFTYKNLDD